jgi:hypothetical protein
MPANSAAAQRRDPMRLPRSLHVIVLVLLGAAGRLVEAYLASEIDKWAKVVKAAGMKAD